MMIPVILALVIAYAVLGAILVAVLFYSRAPVVVRALCTVGVVVLFFATYWAIGEIRGLPTDSAPPPSFRLHWARVVEPDKLSGEKGSIFLWIEALDEDNYPSGLPRAYRLPYSRELDDLVSNALAQISDGQEVAGKIEQNAGEDDTSERLANDIESDQNGNNSAALGDRFLAFDFGDISFENAPAPVTPEKPVN